MKLNNFTPDEAGSLYMLFAEAMADPNRQEQGVRIKQVDTLSKL